MLRTNTPSEVRAKAATKWPEGAQYIYNQLGHHLNVSIRGVTAAQVEAVRDEEAEFALFADEPLILVCCRFGAAVPWMIATFCWHLVPRPMRNLPPAAGLPGEQPLKLAVRLLEMKDGSVRAERELSLDLDFTRALHEAILDQARLNFDPRSLERAQAGLERHYPTPPAVVARARVRCLVHDLKTGL
ncbi:MAG: hypothetical protein ABI353_04130 [Isosphaeraceae bacterium]